MSIEAGPGAQNEENLQSGEFSIADEQLLEIQRKIRESEGNPGASVVSVTDELPERKREMAFEILKRNYGLEIKTDDEKLLWITTKVKGGELIITVDKENPQSVEVMFQGQKEKS